MNFNNFFSELERRKVYRVVIGYGIVAWLIAQIGGLILSSFEAPAWIMKILIILLLVGLPIAMILSWIFDLGPDGIVKTKALKKGSTQERKRMSFKLAFSIITLMTVLIFAGWWSWTKLANDNQKPIESLAILPFDNFTRDQDQEMIAEGLQDDLITTISKIASLRVTPRPSTVRYKETEKSSLEIASELGVDAIVEASILKFDKIVRINVQLIGIYPVERNIWSGRFERPLSEIYALFNDVTQSLAREINLALTPEEKIVLSNADLVIPEAYKAYNTGKIYWDQLTPSSLQKSLKYYQLAIKRDSNFLLPYLGIINVWGGRKQMGLASHHEAYSEAKNILEKAHKILGNDPNRLNETLSWMEWDWKKREKDFKIKLKKNPSDATGHAFYANFLMIFKRFKEAENHTQIALTLDPYNSLVQGLYLTDLNKLRAYEEVIDYVLKNDLHHPLARNALRESYYLSDQFGLAIQEEISFAENVKKDMELKNTLESGYQEGGYIKAFKNAADLLAKRSENTFIPCSLISKYYAKAKQKEKTLEWLEKGYKQRDADLPYITVVHLYDFVREEPKFKAILDKMNLPNS